MMKQKTYLLSALAALLLTACEKPLLSENQTPADTEDGNLTVSIYQLGQMPFETRTRAAGIEACTHLNFAVYDMDGTRLHKKNQVAGDADFGSTTFQLTEGSYQLVALAHSSNGNPTMTNPAKIQFTNSIGYSDTFLYHTAVTVGSEAQTLAIALQRIVALCRFVINDAIPEGIARLEFTYKGGSGHFDAATGLGVTNSTQVMRYDVQAGKQQTQYDLYTFLHELSGTIHLKVSAYDSSGNLQHEREFDVPMEQNKITWLSGDFFNGVTPVASQALTTTVTLTTAWGGERHETY